METLRAATNLAWSDDTLGKPITWERGRSVPQVVPVLQLMQL